MLPTQWPLKASLYSGVVPNPLPEALGNTPNVPSVELRPRRAELGAPAGMDAWIDTYHAVRGLVRQGMFVYLTDSAVGAKEENNLRHLVNNLGTDVARSHVIPFLTTKHTREYCISYAERALHEGFPSLVVLGGDKSGQWAEWYEWAIPAADVLYDEYLDELRKERLIE